jgi:hypothetical protein
LKAVAQEKCIENSVNASGRKVTDFPGKMQAPALLSAARKVLSASAEWAALAAGWLGVYTSTHMTSAYTANLRGKGGDLCPRWRRSSKSLIGKALRFAQAADPLYPAGNFQAHWTSTTCSR